MSQKKSKVTVYRKPALVGAPFLLKILIDGEARGSIGNGETLELELDSGKYKIQTQLFLNHSPEVEFEIAQGQVIELISYPMRIVQVLSLGLCNSLCLKKKVKEEDLDPALDYCSLSELHEESDMDIE